MTDATSNDVMPLRVRPVTAADEAILLDWSNDPATRANAFSSAPIVAEVHHRWLAARLEVPSPFFVVETSGGAPIGQVRFDKKQDLLVISYSLAPEWRGQGLGAAMLQTACAALEPALAQMCLVGYVKPANAASRRIFEKLHFSIYAENEASVEFRRLMPQSEETIA